MKTFRLFSMAALALAMAACSSEENTLETQSPAANGKLHFTATIATPDNGSGTRTEYSEQTTDGTINVAWKENDEIAAIVKNSEDKLVKTVLTVSKVNDDGSATITGDITIPKNGEETVDLIYPADIVTVAADGSDYSISFEKMSDGTTLDGTLKSIYENIDYRRADDCELTVSGEQATLTSAAKLESKLSIWKLTLQDKNGNDLSASKVTIVNSDRVAVASATLATAGSTAYLPVPATTGNICITATIADNDYFYMKEGVTLETGKYYQSTVQMTKGAHLAFLSADYEAKDGAILTGTLASNVKISIANNATVTLDGVTINGVKNSSYGWAGITCLGDATIILKDGTTNTVKGFKADYPGIFIASGNTLTIDGTGSLNASSNGSGAGIGGGYQIACGNIEIQGGTITATGGSNSAGIGSGRNSSCGNITISGGSVTATGGANGAGIGSGYAGSCGNITITSDVTSVTATKGDYATNSIGAGNNGSCGTVTIGCTLDTDGNPVGGTTGAITQSPYEYSAPPALTLTNPAAGQVIGSDGKNYAANATLPTGVTKVAMIAYVSGSNGLAIALADESGYMDWATAKSTCEAKTPAFTGGTWKLPSLDEWKNMLTYDGDYWNNNLQTALSTAGGNSSKLQEWMYYWSSTDYVSDNTQACDVEFMSGYANFSNESKTSPSSSMLVRAVLAF